MRCWHKDLIPVLPRQQLLGQWRECCLIAKNITEKGTPNHILVNRIMEYPMYDFVKYTALVVDEMKRRGYKVDISRFDKYKIYFFGIDKLIYLPDTDDVFLDWHNDRYLRECLYNLEEKAICGGISSDEWKTIYNKYGGKYDLWKN